MSIDAIKRIALTTATAPMNVGALQYVMAQLAAAAANPPSGVGSNGDWLDKSADLGNGMWDMLTAGLSRRVRQAIGYDLANYNSGWYFAGECLGVGTGVAMSFVNPCEVPGILAMGVRAFNAAELAGNALNAVQDFQIKTTLAWRATWRGWRSTPASC